MPCSYELFVHFARYLEEKRIAVDKALDASLPLLDPNCALVIESMRYSLMAGGICMYHSFWIF
jgi:hypothetical protein